MCRLIKVLIVEDQRLCVAALRKVFEDLEHISLVAHLESGSELRKKLVELRPDVLILDLNLPGKHGLEILKEIRPLHPEMVIVILTMHEEQLFIDRAMEYGANAFLSKKVDLDELECVLHLSCTDAFYLGKYLHSEKRTKFPLVTSREMEVIRLIAEGKSSSQISELLFISRETVKTHRKNIFRKLNLKKASELVKYAYKHQII